MLAVLGTQRVLAADLYWDGSGSSWASASSWSTASNNALPDPASPPGNLDTARFNITGLNSTQTVNLNADQSALGLVFTSTGSTTLLGGGTDRTLTVGSGGITISGSGSVTAGSSTSGQNVAIAGSGGITKGGVGSLTLLGGNSYTGAAAVNTGSLVVGNNTALGGTGVSSGTTVATGAELLLTNGVIVTGESVTINGTGSNFNGALSTVAGAAAEWAGEVILGGSDARVGTTNGGVLKISGVIKDGIGNNLFVGMGNGTLGNGTVILSGANVYTGATNLVRGTLKIGATDSLSTGTTLDVAYSTSTDAATFDLNGFNQTVGGLTRSGTGSGGSFITNSGTADSTLTVNQSANTTYTGIIQDGSKKISLTKSDIGTLTLTKANTYSGNTSITGGKLALTLTGAIASTPLITVGTGGTLDVSGLTASGWTVGASQKLTGTGTVSGKTTTIAGTLGSGLNFTGGAGANNLVMGSGSIFEWDINSAGTFSATDVAGNFTGAGAVFKILLTNPTGTFWDSDHSWTLADIFSPGSITGTFASIFTTLDASPISTGGRGFSISGGKLNFAAVPEPTGALAGVLLGAGLLRRRRALIAGSAS